MTRAAGHLTSARTIRRRLLWLLTLTFGGLLIVSTVLWLAVLIWFFGRAPASRNPFIPRDLHDSLQIYYRARGSWAGVENEFGLGTETGRQLSFANQWDSVLLLDEANRVLIDQGYVNTARVGQPYTPDRGDSVYPITAAGAPVGTLVYTGRLPTRAMFVIVFLLPPVMVVACFAGVLTLIIGLLLMRRVVTPLADVIATAQEVAAGNLSARVEVRGAGDMRSLSDSFNHMADSLERNDRERRAMLADVAHELRTPLTIMRGRLEGILDGIYPLSEEQIAPALEEVYILDKLVEDLRLLTLAEARQLALDCREIDLGEIAQRTVSLFEAEAADKGIVLTTEIEPGLPAIQADPQRIGQIIGNLLSNALRYMSDPPGQVTLAVKRHERNEQGIMVSISDTGPGIAETDRPYLFDRFWRAEKSRARTSGGAGLGLAIAKQLVELHHGTIGVESTLDQGARFWFTLPLK
jgi:signal transduction histidine kinase